MTIVLAIILWIACGYVSAGFRTAWFRNNPEVAPSPATQMAMNVISLIGGPGALFADAVTYGSKVFTSGFDSTWFNNKD